MSTHWFTDSSAQLAHHKFSEKFKPIIAAMLGPGYELSHMGVNKNDLTGEVVLKLHLNPIGRVRAASDPPKLEQP